MTTGDPDDRQRYPFWQWLQIAENRKLEDELAKLSRERARLEAINPDLPARLEYLRRAGGWVEAKMNALDAMYDGLVWQAKAIEAELARRRAIGQDVIRLDHERRTVTFAGGTLDLRRRKPAFETVKRLVESRQSGRGDVVVDEEFKKAVGVPKSSELRHSLRDLFGPGKLIVVGDLPGTIRLNEDLLKPLPGPGPDNPKSARTLRRRETP